MIPQYARSSIGYNCERTRTRGRTWKYAPRLQQALEVPAVKNDSRPTSVYRYYVDRGDV